MSQTQTTSSGGTGPLPTTTLDPSGAAGVRISAEGPSIAAILAALGGAATAPASLPASTSGGGSGAAGSGTGAPVSSTPAPAQSGPLTMDNVTDGSDVTLGSGPDTLVMVLANNPTTPGNCQLDVIFDMADGSVLPVAGPLTVSSGKGQGGGQVFTLRSTWGKLGKDIKDVRLVPYGSHGMSALWLNQVTYNMVPLAAAAGQPTDSRGGTTDGFNGQTWDCVGIPLVYVQQPVAPPAAATPPTPAAPNNLAPLLANATAGSTVTLPGGTTLGDAGIQVPCTVAGAADGSTVIDGTGNRPFQGKALLVPLVSGSTISNLTLQNAVLSAAEGGNGAGIRNGGPGIGFTAKSVKVRGCQMGILTFGADVTIDTCDLSGNGVGDGFTHNFYGGTGPGTNRLVNVISGGSKGGHALKNRTQVLRVSGGTYTSGTNDAGGASIIDLPEGGDQQLDGATLVMRGGANNTVFIGYGMENGNATVVPNGKVLLLSNFIFDNQTGGATHLMGPGSIFSDSVLVLQNCKGKGVLPDISGFGSVQGTIAVA